ncbi:MAG TPA: 3-hydroxyacyl-CoA dehydrogenase NAD-binding domain-containing protein [Tepidisphaeraceae bacterium]|jgi:3-hydroxyacyl-CoA dehydrogenase/enoyl-CoA hydratase/3-hydroxybutyryl-CoA epimerase|nr:3-hydroxyacyl-CoA dehydrogenase NAD-binding domain-containing protein [Tepidisphaeraceae bacterium]
MESVVRSIRDDQNIVTVWLDVPGKPVNICSPQLLADLSQALDSIEHDKPAGVIFSSPKPKSFNAGADLFEIRKMMREQVLQYLADGQALFNRIAALSMPTVAAINGDCLGGGFEFALACRYRVAADTGSINIGLPEVKLGLIPGWGGTTRLPRTIGLTKALPILLAGKTMSPKKALRAGLVDEVVRPEALLAAARRLLQTKPARRQPGQLDRLLASTALLRRRVLDSAEAEARRTTYDNYPAPLKLLDAIRIGYDAGVSAGFDAERRALVELMDTDVTKNLMRLFFLRQGSKKWAAEQVGTEAAEVKHVAVIGGGTMGAGIVHSLIRAGFPVRLIEADANALSAALQRIRGLLDEDVSAKKLDSLAARHAFNRVAPSADWTGLGLADLVIEAIVENIGAKQDIFARLDRLTREGAVLATNTSSLSVTELAAATRHPDRVVGMHFFNPVNKMPLAEIIRTNHSSNSALATAVAVATKMGKTPLIVGDAPGFVVNRVLIPYLREALLIALEGTPIPEIDDAMKRWGMPMGPFELLDEIGLDVAVYVLKSLVRDGTDPVPPALKVAIERKWLGKKTGRGFYVHSKSYRRGASTKLNLNAELAAMLFIGEPRHLDTKDIQWRLVLPMINEAGRLLEEGVIDSTDALDLAMVLGLGLAPFRGGLVHYANTVGIDEVVRRLADLTDRHGPRFSPCDFLRTLAAAHSPMDVGPAPRRTRVTTESVNRAT